MVRFPPAFCVTSARYVKGCSRGPHPVPAARIRVIDPDRSSGRYHQPGHELLPVGDSRGGRRCPHRRPRRSSAGPARARTSVWTAESSCSPPSRPPPLGVPRILTNGPFCSRSRQSDSALVAERFTSAQNYRRCSSKSTVPARGQERYASCVGSARRSAVLRDAQRVVGEFDVVVARARRRRARRCSRVPGLIGSRLSVGIWVPK